MKKTFLILPVLFSLFACSTHQYVFLGKGPNRTVDGIKPDLTKTNHFILWGLMQTKSVDIVSICDRGDNTVTIKNYKSIYNNIFTVSTAGIYAPTTTDIYCRY